VSGAKSLNTPGFHGDVAGDCSVEIIHEELDKREYRERDKGSECLVTERLTRNADVNYAELKLLREKLCYYGDEEEDEEEEYNEEYTVGVDGNKAFTYIVLDDDEDVDEVELDVRRAEKIRSLILNAKSQDDFHMIWNIVSKYVDDVELDAELKTP
jgi:hypothetical protein